MMNSGCISWRSKKQRTVALSSTEAEYMELTEAVQEALWLKAFLCELGEMKSNKAVKVYEDNQGVIALTKRSGPSISGDAIALCVNEWKTAKSCCSTARRRR